MAINALNVSGASNNEHSILIQESKGWLTWAEDQSWTEDAGALVIPIRTGVLGALRTLTVLPQASAQK